MRYSLSIYSAGIGALYVRRRPRVRVEAPQSGGGQERGMRSGTVPTPLCVGIGAACDLSMKEMEVCGQGEFRFYGNCFPADSLRFKPSWVRCEISGRDCVFFQVLCSLRSNNFK